MNNQVVVQVPTSALRKLLDDDPGVVIRLQAMACEKIAEELSRKVLQRNEKELVAMVTKLLPTEWGTGKLTAKAQKIIDDQVKDALRVQIREQIDGITKMVVDGTIERLVFQLSGHVTRHTKALDAWAAKQKQDHLDYVHELRGVVKQLARDEFLAVLKEVKESTS
jgi:hypothetical protein